MFLCVRLFVSNQSAEQRPLLAIRYTNIISSGRCSRKYSNTCNHSYDLYEQATVGLQELNVLLFALTHRKGFGPNKFELNLKFAGLLGG